MRVGGDSQGVVRRRCSVLSDAMSGYGRVEIRIVLFGLKGLLQVHF